MGDERELVHHIYHDLTQHGFTLSLIPVRSLSVSGVPCGAYFSEADKCIAVATDRPKRFWLRRLLHEYAHFHQWLDGSDVWKQAVGLDLFGAWLSGQCELTAEQKATQITAGALLELDCEKRAAAMLSRWDIGVTRGQYVPAANAYVLSWWVAAEHRVWLATEALDRYETEIEALFPKRFLPAYRYAELHRYPCLVEFLLEHCMRKVVSS